MHAAPRAASVTPMDYIFTVGRRKRAVARVFLYKEGKEDEALEANKNAQSAVEKCLQNPKYGDENEYLNYIKEHRLAIENKNWLKYP